MTDKIQKIAEQMGELLVKLTHVNIEIRMGYVEFQQKQKKLTKQLLQELSKQSKDTAFNMKEINLRRAAEANLNALKEENVGLLACIRKFEAELSKSKDIYCENGHAEVVGVGNTFKCVKCGEIIRGISLKSFVKKKWFRHE
jgi:hypothetical protein